MIFDICRKSQYFFQILTKNGQYMLEVKYYTEVLFSFIEEMISRFFQIRYIDPCGFKDRRILIVRNMTDFLIMYLSEPKYFENVS